MRNRECAERRTPVDVGEFRTVVDLLPDPDAMVRFCCEDLPRVLISRCGVDVGQAKAIGDDVLARARAFAVSPDNVA